MQPQRPLPTVPFVWSRYAEAQTLAAAIIAAFCPGGAIPTSTGRWAAPALGPAHCSRSG